METFDTLFEAQVMTARWRRDYNAARPHSALGYVAPAPEATQPWLSSSASLNSPATGDTAVTLTWRLVPHMGEVTHRRCASRTAVSCTDPTRKGKRR